MNRCVTAICLFQEPLVCKGHSFCADGSDNLCDDPCVPQGVNGKHVFKVSDFVCLSAFNIIKHSSSPGTAKENMLLFPFQRCVENNAHCVPLSWLCDGKTDCPQGSDEQHCACEKYNMKDCTLGENITFCVPESWICNLDCAEQEKQTCQLPPPNITKCGQDEFQCYSQETCISQNSVCDRLSDCEGSEDEIYCEGLLKAWLFELF